MQSFKKIMSDLGFYKDAPVDVQKAFIKNLIAAAEQTRAPQSVEDNSRQKSSIQYSSKNAQPNGQLEFNFGIQNQTDLALQKNKKRVS